MLEIIKNFEKQISINANLKNNLSGILSGFHGAIFNFSCKAEGVKLCGNVSLSSSISLTILFLINSLNVLGHIKKYVNIISRISISIDDVTVAKESFRLLKFFCSKDLRMSEYAILAQAILTNYFKVVKMTELSGGKEFCLPVVLICQ